jgi:parallel beta-helix repeat protein
VETPSVAGKNGCGESGRRPTAMAHSILHVRLRLILALAAIAALATVVGLSVTSRPGAEAGVSSVVCGDIIGPGEHVQLDSDLLCSEPPALTVIGPAVLDLNGLTLTCTAPHIGIEIKGTGAVVKNGHVFGCHEGVLVGGHGFHGVSNVEVSTLEGNTGIVVNSNHNLIVANNVHDSIHPGILVTGSYNAIERNTLHHNNTGITVTGSYNAIKRNTLHHNNPNGIDIEGDKNVVSRNTCSENDFNGIEINGDRNFVSRNTCNENGVDGIEVDDGDKNWVMGNKTNNNATNGIDVQPDNQSNRLIFNVSFGNDPPDFLTADMNDDSGGCEANVWRFNFFETALPTCIR